MPPHPGTLQATGLLHHSQGLCPTARSTCYSSPVSNTQGGQLEQKGVLWPFMPMPAHPPALGLNTWSQGPCTGAHLFPPLPSPLWLAEFPSCLPEFPHPQHTGKWEAVQGFIEWKLALPALDKAPCPIPELAPLMAWPPAWAATHPPYSPSARAGCVWATSTHELYWSWPCGEGGQAA